MDKNSKNPRRNPREGVNLFSLLTFAWVLQFFRIGFRRDLQEEDLFPPLKNQSSRFLGERLENLWMKEIERCKRKSKCQPSLWKALLKCFGAEIFTIGIFQLFLEIFIRIPQPILLGKLLIYFNGNPDGITIEEASYWAGGLILSFILAGPLLQFSIYSMTHIGMKFRIASCSLIYRKVMRTSRNPKIQTTAGQIVNFLSNDVMTLDLTLVSCNYLWIGPIKTVIVVYIMYLEVDLSASFGIFFILFLVVVQGYVSKFISKFALKAATKTDQRLRIMNEIILGVQVIKMYAWEKPFSHLINNARTGEIKAIRNSAFVDILVIAIQWYAARVGIFITIVSFVLLGNKITVEKVFMVTAFYNDLKNCWNVMFTYSLLRIAQSSASIERIRTFLISEELQTESVTNSKNGINNKTQITTPSESIISFKNVSAKWIPDSKDNTLNNINFSANPGSLTAIIGEVGSGKTSFLQLILGELPLQSGTIQIHGKLTYVSQEPWIFAASIRQNILFGQPMNKERYDKVIKVCQLERDFSLFPHKDQTFIGEKGSNLSGGQRSRINLARAVYAEADIYLLDDPLSAVDTHVGRSIFKDCICDFLKEKSRILVTHQLQYLQNVDQTYVLHDGSVQMSGTFQDLRNSKLEFLSFLQTGDDPETTDKSGNELTVEEFKSSDVVSEQEQRGVVEQTASGNMSKEVYLSYLKAAGSVWILMIVLILSILMATLICAGDYFLAYWVTWKEMKDRGTEEYYLEGRMKKSELGEDDYWYIYVYSGLIASAVVVVYLKHFMFTTMCMESSKNLHASVFQSVIRTTMTFFHNNPSGRIMNRFSKDMGMMDKFLPVTINDVSSCAIYTLGVVVTTISINYWMMIPLAFTVVVLFLLRTIYWRTSRSVKRLEGTTKSPIFNHLSSTLQGITTIRAFKAEEFLTREFDAHQDLHTATWFLFISCCRTFSFYVELLCAIYLGFIICFFMVFDDMNTAGNVALVITQTISMTLMLQWGMNQTVELETNMTAVERILEYTKIPGEPPLESDLENKPPAEWPTKGQIEFRNVCLKYSPEGSPVLKNLSFVLEPKEKIGIVGRTGAGKSSMIVALFRLAPLEGEIYIDGLATSNLGLHDLRSKVSIIPQEPLLFAGTLRYNLDPFEDYSDDVLWQSLAEVELKSVVEDMVAGLYSKVTDGGANFSVGQRQLLCLARAIIRKNRILVLDEATANVDPKTDSLIQKTIRRRFEDCTVLIIAHRLNTVMDCDRFIVMDEGHMVEFDNSYSLLQKEEGYLHEMVRQSGPEMAAILRTVAELKYHNRRGSTKL